MTNKIDGKGIVTSWPLDLIEYTRPESSIRVTRTQPSQKPQNDLTTNRGNKTPRYRTPHLISDEDPIGTYLDLIA